MRRSTLGLAAAALMLLGPALTAPRLVPGLVGFALFALGGILATGVAAASAVQAARGRGFTLGGKVALVAAVVFLGAASRGAGLPRTNDFTTDLDDPPAFGYAATLPENTGRDMGYPPAFADAQRACCPDLAPARLPETPDAAFDRALETAKTMEAWRLTRADKSEGVIEAIATTGVFGFHDDVVVRVRPDGGGSRVNVRSKSRDGKGDLGANAARIRAYLAALAAEHG